MTVEIQEVRDYLNKITTSRVHDDTITINIELANTIVENESSKEASDETIKDAVLTQAGYLSYLSYATEFERSVGRVPPPMLIHIDRLKAIADKFLTYAKRADNEQRKPPIMELSDTVSKRFRTLRHGTGL